MQPLRAVLVNAYPINTNMTSYVRSPFRRVNMNYDVVLICTQIYPDKTQCLLML